MSGTVLSTPCINQDRESIPSLTCIHLTQFFLSPNFWLWGIAKILVEDVLSVFHFLHSTIFSKKDPQRTGGSKVIHRAFYTLIFGSFPPSYHCSYRSFQGHPPHPLLPTPIVITFYPAHPFTPSLWGSWLLQMESISLPWPFIRWHARNFLWYVSAKINFKKYSTSQLCLKSVHFSQGWVQAGPTICWSLHLESRGNCEDYKI